MHNPVRALKRWMEVQMLMVRYGLDFLIDQDQVQPARDLARKLGWKLGQYDDVSLPERVGLLLEELGPMYVKLGQMVSSRNDMIPAEWSSALGRLHNEVAPIPYSEVAQVVQEELGATPDEAYAAFASDPVAAASIGQVHTALTETGDDVVVKVQRPGIRPQIESDLQIMREFARILSSRMAWARNYGLNGIVDEFARGLMSELDYTNEARNADQLRENMKRFPQVHVPFIYRDQLTHRVLTMERIKGVKVSDAEALDATGIDRVAMAALVVRSIFHQILIDGFFHADPHPGNIWVDTENQKLVFLDLGLMGTLPENLRTELGNLMRAIAERNAEEIVRVVMSIGTPFKPVDEDSLLREVQLLLDKYLSSSLADVSFADVVQAMLTTVFKEGIRLPNQLVLGVKALVQAEAIARTLNPAIMLSEIAETVGEQVVAHRLSPEVLLAELMREGRMIQRLVQNLPRSANDILRQMQSSGLRVDASLRNYEGWQGRQVAATNRLTAGVILVGVILASAMFVGSPAFADHLILRVTAVGGFLVALLLALLLVALTLLEGWRWRG